MNTNDSLAENGFSAPEALNVSIGTHNGPFHADDVFAVALLKVMGVSGPVVRSRDPQVLGPLDILVDVGGEYDPSSHAFDHHFLGAPVRENGVPFASLGMVAHKFCRREVQDNEVLRSLTEAIDAADNGIKQDGWSLSLTVHKCNPLVTGNFDERFTVLVQIAQEVLRGVLEEGYCLEFAVTRFESHPQVVEWVNEHDAALAASAIRIRSAFEQEGPVITLDRYEPALMDEGPNAPTSKVFSVYPSPSGEWMIQQIPLQQGSFAGRKQLPEAWAGKRGEALDAVTGVEGGVFTHPGRFIGGHKSKEGALRLAHLAAAE